MKILWLVPAVVVLVGVLAADRVRAGQAEKRPSGPFTVYPIGRVQKTEGHTRLVLDPKYQPGLLGLDGFSHVHVVWWFDKNDTPEGRSVLQVHPRGDQGIPLTGVFATRSPSRPNLIALSLCRILFIKDNIVEVDDIDADPDTPILDLKPYAPELDSASPVRAPDWWSRPRPKE
jgi:tRNA (adenine37-N6)-methyltransferase